MDSHLSQDDSTVESIPVARNYSTIWTKFPDYSVENTIMVSNHYNELPEF